MEKHCGFLWNSMGLRLRNDTAGGIMSTGMHLNHCRTTQLRLIIWQYWIDWHHDRQRAAKKNTGSLYYLFAVRNLWGQWRQCLFSVIYRLVACLKNLFVNHEFKVGSESGRCCIIASTSLRLSDIRKKSTEWREVAVRVLKNSQAQQNHLDDRHQPYRNKDQCALGLICAFRKIFTNSREICRAIIYGKHDTC